MTDTAAYKRMPFFVVIALLLLWGGVAVHVAGDMVWGTDDAYITYRYARNIARGHGPVFNPGERVEGCSTLLYALLLAPAFFILDDNHVYFFSVALNLLFLSGALLIFLRHIRQRLPRRWTAVACLLFAVAPFMWRATATGMETTLVLLIQLGLWIAVTRVEAAQSRRDTVLLCVVLVVSILARADGFVAPGIAVLYLLLKRRYRAGCWALAVTASTLGACVAWRLAYYGYPLPNTYYAKVAGPLALRVEGAFRHLMQITFAWGLLPSLAGLLIPVVLWGMTGLWVGKRWLGRWLRPPARLADAFPMTGALWGRVRPVLAWPCRFVPPDAGSWRPAVPFETFFACCWIGYWHYIGGDFVGVRFLLPLFPLGTYALLTWLAPKLRWRPAPGVVFVGLVLFQLAPLATNSHFDYTFKKYDGWQRAGIFLRDHHHGRTLAVDAAGKMPFFSDLYTIDMLGLNDEYIGHQPVKRAALVPGHSKWDTAYVLGRRPDLIAAFPYIDTSLQYGLSTHRYEQAGYRLAYVVYLTPPDDGAAPILDVRDLSPEEQAERLRAGMAMGILERVPR